MESKPTHRAPMPARAKAVRVCALVVGMHRSGTSCLAGTLARMGFAAPEGLIGADDDNPRGHYEATAIARLDDRILEFAGCDWRDWRAFNDNWHDTPYFDRFVDEARAVLADEYGDAPMFVLKDPRLCRLAPFWLEVLRRETIRPLLFLPIRDPAEVARSLEKRDGIPPVIGALLWLRYTLDAERGTRDAERTFLRYTDLVDDWRSVVAAAETALAMRMPRAGPKVAAAVDAFIAPDLRRNRAEDAPAGTAELPDIVRRGQAIFERWATAGEDEADRDALDALDAELGELADRVAPLWDAADRIARQGREARKKISAATASLDALDGRGVAKGGRKGNAGIDGASLADHRAALDKIDAAVAGLTEAMKPMGEALPRLLGAGPTLAPGAARAQAAELDALAARNAAAEAEIAALGQRVREAEAEALAARAESQGRLSSLASELEQKRSETDSVYAERDALKAEHDRLAAALGEQAASAGRIAELEAAHAEALAATDAIRAEAARAADELVEAFGDIVMIGNLLRNEEQAHAQAKAALAAAEQRAATLADRLDRAEREAADQRTALDDAVVALRLKIDERKTIQASRDALNEELDSARRDAKRLAGKVDEQLGQADRDRERLQAEVERLREERVGIEARMLDQINRLRRANDDTLQDKAVLVAQYEAMARQVEQLTQQAGEQDQRIAALAADRDQATDALAARTSQAASLEADTRALQEELGEALVELESVARQHAETMQAAADERAERDRQLAGLESQLATSRAGEADLRSAYQRKVEERRALQAAKIAIEREHKQLATRAAELEHDSSDMAARLRKAKRNAGIMAQVTRMMALEQVRLPTSGFAPLRNRRWAAFKAKVARAGLFDDRDYLAANPDVAASGIDPLLHFITVGLEANRSTRPKSST